MKAVLSSCSTEESSKKATERIRSPYSDVSDLSCIKFELTHKAVEKKLRDLRKQKKALYDDKVIDSMVRWRRLQAIAEAEEKLFDEYNRRFAEVKP